MPRRVSEQGVSSYPIKLFKGITYSRTFEYKNSDDTPIDLTGKSIVIQVKDVFTTTLVLDSAGGATALGSEVVITDALDGKFRLKITDEETETAEVTTEGKYWIELHDTGDIILLWKDCVIVEEI